MGHVIPNLKRTWSTQPPTIGGTSAAAVAPIALRAATRAA